MKTEYAQFYGIQNEQIKHLTEDMIDINKVQPQSTPINEFTMEVGEMDQKSLLLPEEDEEENNIPTPNQNSLAHIHHITNPAGYHTDKQLQDILRRREEEHDHFIKRREEEHVRENNHIKEKYEQLLKEASQLKHEQDLTLDEPDQFCTGKDIPDDWTEEVTNFEPFPFSKDPKFLEMMKDGTEPSLGLSDPFKYEEYRHSQVISGELVSAYLKQAGDKRIL